MSANWFWHSLLVGAGGFLGSILRFGVGGLVYRVFPFANIPYGTLAVNVIGCFVLGLLGGMADARGVVGPELRMFLFIGVLGGFTTFSTFGYETLALVREAQHGWAVANVGLHVVAGLLAVWIGYAFGRT